MNEAQRIRPAGVAGAFYPGQADQLAADVDRMLAEVTPVDTTPPRVLLAPHAGYVYSGAVAAHSYRLLAPNPPTTAVLIGPSHFEAFSYSSLFEGHGYQTPLGVVTIDHDINGALAEGADSIRVSDAGHVQPRSPYKEHGLEVQLPFLQRVAPDARIVPVIMGDQSWQHCLELGHRLAPLLERDDVVVVVSSDLSHFYDYDTAKQKDEAFCRRVEALDARALFDAVRSGECEACGAGPMIAALLANAERDSTCEIITLLNSGDVSGDHHSVVGYAAAAIADRHGVS